MLYYKVLARHFGELKSVTHYSLGRYATTYNVGVPTRPKVENTLLFVFSSLEAAIAYTSFYEEIWECEAEIADTPVYRCIIDRLVDFWKVYNNKNHMVLMDEFGGHIKDEDEKVSIFKGDDPITRATLFAKSVTLLRVIPH